MGFKKKQRKKSNGGIKPGTYVTLYNGYDGVVTESNRRETTIKELQFIKEFESTFTMPTSQAKNLVKKA